MLLKDMILWRKYPALESFRPANWDGKAGSLDSIRVAHASRDLWKDPTTFGVCNSELALCRGDSIILQAKAGETLDEVRARLLTVDLSMVTYALWYRWGLVGTEATKCNLVIVLPPIRRWLRLRPAVTWAEMVYSLLEDFLE